MTNIDLDDLKAKAEAAIEQGEPRVWLGNGVVPAPEDTYTYKKTAYEEFYDAASPAHVLALVDQLQRAQALEAALILFAGELDEYARGRLMRLLEISKQ